MKRILSIIMVLCLISLASAITIYSGESITIELEKQFEYYSIVGNSTPVDITITQNGNFVTIIPDKYSLNDSYEIIFFDSEKEIITVYKSSGGGGGSTRTIYKDRNITEYVDKEVIKEVEVKGDNIEVEKLVKNTSWVLWIFVVIILLLSLVSYLVFFRKPETVERRLKNNE